MQWFEFLAGSSAPERRDPVSTSPCLAMEAHLIAWHACKHSRFWPLETQRGTDQDQLEHGVLQWVVDAGGRIAVLVVRIPLHPVSKVQK